MSRMTLYNWWRSTCSHRVRIALAMKGVEYEHAVVRLPSGEQSGDEHRARSATMYVPCLVIDGVPYVESVAIIEMLEELHPAPPLYPKDAHGRARVRALVEIVNSGIQPLQNSGVLAHLGEVLGVPVSLSKGPIRAWMHHWIERGLGSLERAMETNEREGVDGPYAYGAAPTAADVYLVPQVLAAKRLGVAIEPCARVLRAFEAASRLDAFRKAAPENQIDADVADAVKSAR
jgi:maleylacetoacetate isomerase